MVDGVYWTLNVEILFYALIALAWRAGLTLRIDWLVLGWMALRLSCWLLPVPAWVQQLPLIAHASCFAIGLIAARQWSARGLAPGGEALAVAAAVIAVTALTGDGHATLLTMGIAALFAVVVHYRAGWLAHPALLWLGAISYPFYLLHAVIGYAIIARLQAMGTGAAGTAIVALGSTLALATIVARAADRWRRPAPAPAIRPAMA